jgi:hypothetical protein
MKLVLTTKHVPETNSRGSRVKIAWPAHSKSVTRGWAHTLSGSDKQAIAALAPLGMDWSIGDAGKDGYFLITDWPIGDDVKCDAIRAFFGVK